MFRKHKKNMENIDDIEKITNEIVNNPKYRDKILKQVSDHVGRRSFIAGLLGVSVGMLGASGLASGRTIISDKDINVDGVSLTNKQADLSITAPEPYDVLITKPKWDEDKIYAWRESNNYKGYRLIDWGVSGEDDGKVIQAGLDYIEQIGGGKVVIGSGEYLIERTLNIPEGCFVEGTSVVGKNYGTTINGEIILNSYSNIANLSIIGNIAITVKGYHCVLDSVNVQANRYGIYGNPDSLTNEMIVRNCVITGNGESGSIGIFSNNISDCEILHNIIRGFDIGVKLNKSGCRVIGNHIYKYPVNFYSKGLEINNSWFEIISNYIDNAGIIGIDVVGNVQGIIISSNDIRMEGGDNTISAIRFKRDTIGWLVRVRAVDNIIRANNLSENAIIIENVNRIYRDSIFDNVVSNFNNKGCTVSNGVSSITGDGTTTTFTVNVTHGLIAGDISKVSVIITPSKTCDVSYSFVDLDGDGFNETLQIVLTFATAPTSGEVVYISWSAKVSV